MSNFASHLSHARSIGAKRLCLFIASAIISGEYDVVKKGSLQ